MEKLKQNIGQCQYQQYQQVMKGAFELLNQYNELNSETQQINDGLVNKRYLVINGHVSVQYKGNSYKIFIIIEFPQYYPLVPPVFKIKNVNPTDLICNKIYQKEYSEKEKVIRMALTPNENQMWKMQQNPVSVLQGILNRLGQAFPYFSKGQGQNKYIDERPQLVKYTYPQAQQLQQKVLKDMDQLLIQINKDIQEQKTNMDQIYVHNNALDQAEAQLNLTKQELEQRVNELDKEMKNLNQFWLDNDGKTLNDESVKQIMTPDDELSAQIIDLSSEEEAIADTLLFLENGLKNKQIKLEYFLKEYKTYCEKEYTTKFMLTLCQKNAQKQ